MVDFKALKQAISDSGYKFEDIASAIGLSRQGLYQRFRNEVEFTASEITTLCELLRLSAADKERIFFAPKVE